MILHNLNKSGTVINKGGEIMILDGIWVTDEEVIEIVNRLRHRIDQLREENRELQEQIRQFNLEQEEQDRF